RWMTLPRGWRPTTMASAMDQGRREERLRTPIRPLRLALLYAGLAALWVVVGSYADSLALERSPESEFIIEIVKGLAFLLATGGVFYVLLERLRLRLAATEASLDESRERSQAERRRIERMAKIGHWVWRQDPGPFDWSGGNSEYSESAAAIFGVRPAELAIPTRDYIERFVHPDDRLRMARKFSDPIHAQSGPSLAEYRIIRSDGAVRTIYEVTEMVAEPGDGTAYWQGTVQDVTEIRKTEANLAESEARF